MNEEISQKLKKLDDALGRYVRPDTFPLAIRMLKPGEEVPPDVKIPSKSFKENWIVCQSIGIARRYGWGIAVGRDDVICPLSAIAFGFRKPNDDYLKGYAANGMYCKDEEAAANQFDWLFSRLRACGADFWEAEPSAHERGHHLGAEQLELFFDFIDRHEALVTNHHEPFGVQLLFDSLHLPPYIVHCADKGESRLNQWFHGGRNMLLELGVKLPEQKDRAVARPLHRLLARVAEVYEPCQADTSS